MTRTDRDQIVPRVPAPRLAPDDWFVHQLSELAAASTPSDSVPGARARRVIVIAIASAVLLAGGAYAAERVTGSSFLPGSHEPRPADVPNDRMTPTPEVTPAEPAGTAPARPTADPSDDPDTDAASDTEQSARDDELRGGSHPQSDDATAPSEDDSEGIQDTEHTEDTKDPDDIEDTEDPGDPSSERDSESDDTEETPSENPSPDLDADLDELIPTEEAAAPAALEDN